MKRKFSLPLFIFCTALFFFIASANWMVLSWGDSIVHTVADAPTSTVALVFGGGMKDETTMSEMQEDRMIRAVELYRAGKAKKLLVSGDDGEQRVDEVSAMKAYALSLGVREDDILTDPHGYRTRATCERAWAVFGVTSTVAISQSFHLPRIRYLCARAGVKTVGLSADFRDYPSSWWFAGLREILARGKAVVELH